MQSPILEVHNLAKDFGSVRAVHNISFEIAPGELFALLGGSGSGKTTLLRMIAGFETPTAGQIFIDGQDMAGVLPHARPTNMMFQSYALFPHMSVRRNIAYGLRRAGIKGSELKARVDEMIALVQLDGLSQRKPAQLSGGQRQRVALARALIKRPKLLLLDEPLGALDKKLREETQFELVAIQERFAVAFVVVTHDQEEAMTLADRIGVMHEGKIAQIASPREIYEFPVSRMVADFVGAVNLFAGHVIEDTSSTCRIHSEEAGRNLYVAHGISCAPNQKIWFAIRPEKIRINRSKPEFSENVLEGIIEDSAYFGNQSLYRVKLPTGKIVRVTKTNAERDGTQENYGETVWLSWSERAAVALLQ